MHSSCMPITISRNDPFYSPHDIKCMSFVRSCMISSKPHRVEIGQQVNTVTSFLDHSNIYGLDIKTMKKVRSFNGGRLKTNLKNVLPLENGAYFTGDDRVNQSPFIAIWHSIFLRSHNNFADQLAVINRHWDEERIFQEARKINIAVYQNIIYHEWLPLFIGKSNIFEKTEYDPNSDASTTNEFSSAVFRFMHSFISSEFKLYDENMNVKTFNLSDTITKSKMLENSYDDILRGLMKQKVNLVGYSSEILNKLFKNKHGIGLDLLSVDILRGRDHGIQSYTKYMKMCNVKSNIKVFNDLFPQISKMAITQLRQTYKSVFDIDLIVGGALENIASKENGTDSGLLGPTFSCIMSEQFRRFITGDSYFYSHNKHFSKGWHL
jgi:peroxidase